MTFLPNFRSAASGLVRHTHGYRGPHRDYHTVGVGCRLSLSLLLRYDFTEFHCKCMISLFEFTFNAPVNEAGYLVHSTSWLLICLPGVAAGEKILICIQLPLDRPFSFLFALLLSHLQGGSQPATTPSDQIFLSISAFNKAQWVTVWRTKMVPNAMVPLLSTLSITESLWILLNWSFYWNLALSKVSAGTGNSRYYSCILHIKVKWGKKSYLSCTLLLDICRGVGSSKDVCWCIGILKALL